MGIPVKVELPPEVNTFGELLIWSQGRIPHNAKIEIERDVESEETFVSFNWER